MGTCVSTGDPCPPCAHTGVGNTGVQAGAMGLDAQGGGGVPRERAELPPKKKGEREGGLELGPLSFQGSAGPGGRTSPFVLLLWSDEPRETPPKKNTLNHVTGGDRGRRGQYPDRRAMHSPPTQQPLCTESLSPRQRPDSAKLQTCDWGPVGHSSGISPVPCAAQQHLLLSHEARGRNQPRPVAESARGSSFPSRVTWRALVARLPKLCLISTCSSA